MIFSPGPSTTWTSLAAASSPSARPSSSPSASSQELAMVAVVGKQVAGTEAFSPRWSTAPVCLRRPWGPSERNAAGIPRCRTARLVQVLQPWSMAHFSSRVMLLIIESMLIVFSPFSRLRTIAPCRQGQRAIVKGDQCFSAASLRFLRRISSSAPTNAAARTTSSAMTILIQPSIPAF